MKSRWARVYEEHFSNVNKLPLLWTLLFMLNISREKCFSHNSTYLYLLTWKSHQYMYMYTICHLWLSRIDIETGHLTDNS
jgi:hypothetical protein